jgi:hypothetical protein
VFTTQIEKTVSKCFRLKVKHYTDLIPLNQCISSFCPVQFTHLGTGYAQITTAQLMWDLGLLGPARGMDVCLLCFYVVLSCVGRGLCDGLITRPEESYRVSVCVIIETPKSGPMFETGNESEVNV